MEEEAERASLVYKCGGLVNLSHSPDQMDERDLSDSLRNLKSAFYMMATQCNPSVSPNTVHHFYSRETVSK